jgi:hypothetical protein
MNNGALFPNPVMEGSYARFRWKCGLKLMLTGQVNRLCYRFILKDRPEKRVL